MAVQAKDGSFHHSAGRASLHDETHSGKAPVKQMQKPEHEGGGDGKQQGSIEEHVQAHGPAHTIHYTHDKKTNKHHVHSVHGDGMAHKSEHGSAQEADDHMDKAMGLGGEENEETPDNLAEEQEEQAPAQGGNPFLKS